MGSVATAKSIIGTDKESIGQQKSKENTPGNACDKRVSIMFINKLSK